MRPDVTSALAAKAARSAVISSDSPFAATLVVVVGDGTVVDATAAVVVADVALVAGATVSSVAVSPSAHAETTSTRTVSTMLMRLVTGNPFGAEWRCEAYPFLRRQRAFA
jgi:hypothetical protein